MARRAFAFPGPANDPLRARRSPVPRRQRWRWPRRSRSGRGCRARLALRFGPARARWRSPRGHGTRLGPRTSLEPRRAGAKASGHRCASPAPISSPLTSAMAIATAVQNWSWLSRAPSDSLRASASAMASALGLRASIRPAAFARASARRRRGINLCFQHADRSRLMPVHERAEPSIHGRNRRPRHTPSATMRSRMRVRCPMSAVR